ncbi:pre-mRNA-splicing factor CWC22 [Histomonas meleagridis]|uniref:pre-mRNA-splicing factor CWC22-like n=1 Tax=Histomonas meleagridis TaxID=135588 RepID=UPI00355A811F|nr:pre-mRNA-splicing factor CWC22 [Histomonas meleagridis]KAH0797813.1 pre-mRNA-splicing factor CWC22-like [Histomonas meleagridis]
MENTEPNPVITDPSIEKNIARWNKYVGRIKTAFENANAENLNDVIIDLFRSYLTWTWAVFSRECFNMSAGSRDNAQLCATILAIINSKIGEVGRNTLIYSLYRFNQGMKNHKTNEIQKATIFLGECYRQQLITSTLINELIITLLNEGRRYLLIVIKLLWNVAPLLYDDDTSSLSLIFQTVLKYSEDDEFASHIERLTKWRQNKWCFYTKDGTRIQYFRIPKKYDILEGDIITHDSLSFEDVPEEDITENYIQPHKLEVFDEIRAEYKAFLQEILPDEEEEESGENEQSNISLDSASLKSTEQAVEANKRMKEEKEYQRQVYLHIVSSATSAEAAHTIIKLQQENPGFDNIIVNTCINYVGMEKTFNRNLGTMIHYLCSVSDNNVSIVEKGFYTSYTQCHTYSMHRITNLANLYAYLLSQDAISWKVLSIVRLTEDETNSAQRVFIRFLMEELAKNLSYAGLLKKLNNDNVAQWTSGIFLTDTLEHAEFVVMFFTQIKLEFLLEKVNKEVMRMTEEVNRKREEELALLRKQNVETVDEVQVVDDNDNDNKMENVDEFYEEIEVDEGRRRHRHRHHHRHH